MCIRVEQLVKMILSFIADARGWGINNSNNSNKQKR
jgi:hypothetical protein